MVGGHTPELASPLAMSTLTEDAASGPAPPKVLGKLPGGLSPSSVHVLLVDDERLSRTVVASLLRKCNYKGEGREHAGRSLTGAKGVPLGGERRRGRQSRRHAAQSGAPPLPHPAVTTADDGAQAMELLRQHPPGTYQLVLTVRGGVAGSGRCAGEGA